jgi:chromosomal replication initiation ATPase DnaA
MNQETNNITKVLSELNKTIHVIGADKLIEILKISRENDTDLDDDTIIKSRMIIQIVCDEFQIKYDDFFSRMRKNNRRYAIGITTTLLKDILKLDVADISFLLKKPNNLISIYSNEVMELNPKHKSDIVIIEKIENINTKLKNINYGN